MRCARARSVAAAVAAAALLGACVAAALSSGDFEDFEKQLTALDALIEADEFAAADSVARALLAEAEVAFGKESLAAGRVLDRLVDAGFGLRRVDEDCLALADRAVRIKEETAGGDEPETAQSLRRRGEVLQWLQRSGEARADMERALAIQEEQFGRGSLEAAEVLGPLAQVYIDLDLETDAAHMLEETLAIRDADDATEPATMQRLLYDLANLKRVLGEFEQGESLYHRLLAMTPEGSGERPYVLAGLGLVYSEQARFVEAREALEEAIAITRSSGSDRRALAYHLNNLGFVLASLGDCEEAVRVYTETLEIKRETLGSDHRDTAVTLGNLANAYAEIGELDRARSLHEEVLAIRERVAGRNSAAVGTSLRDLARIDLATGRAEAAIPRLERYVRIRTEHLGPEHYDTGKAKAELARGLAAAGELEAASELYREALSVLRAKLGPESPAWGEASVGLATVEAREGELAESWERALEAGRISRECARLTAASLSERQARRFAATRKEALDLLLSLLAERPGAADVSEAWQEVIRSRALVLDEVSTWRAGLESDPETARRFGEFAAASRRYAALVVGDPGDDDPAGFRRRLSEAREDQERAERELARRSRSQRRSRERRGADLESLRAARPADSALLAYTRYSRTRLDGETTGEGITASYTAFVLPAGGDSAVAIDLGDAATIDRLVEDWRTEVLLPRPGDLPAARGRYRAAGAALRSAIWDPVESSLGDPRLVFVVPDGALHRVSFATLPVEDDRYLLEESTRVHYLSAERDLLSRGSDDEPGTGLLALGGPRFDGPDDASGDSRRPRFSPLPGTAQEAESIARMWDGESLLLTGADATETTLKREAPGRRIVHLATHGFFRADRRAVPRASSRGIGGLGPRQPAASSPVASLALSGLALAGANSSPPSSGDDDGILTAEEIASLDFSGTEWVVLSACDTGLGDIEAGEGVVGLRRAFEVSGVGTIVMSLWDVEDEAARRWMEELYRSRFTHGRSTIESVSGASRAVLEWCRAQRGTDHPYFWGAFIAVGDWE